MLTNENALGFNHYFNCYSRKISICKFNYYDDFLKYTIKIIKESLRRRKKYECIVILQNFKSLNHIVIFLQSVDLFQYSMRYYFLNIININIRLHTCVCYNPEIIDCQIAIFGPRLCGHNCVWYRKDWRFLNKISMEIIWRHTQLCFNYANRLQARFLYRLFVRLTSVRKLIRFRRFFHMNYVKYVINIVSC